jgi:hypothetical protein
MGCPGVSKEKQGAKCLKNISSPPQELNPRTDSVSNVHDNHWQNLWQCCIVKVNDHCCQLQNKVIPLPKRYNYLKTCVTADVKLHVFVVSTVDWIDGQLDLPTRFSSQHKLDRKLRGPRELSLSDGEQKNIRCCREQTSRLTSLLLFI